MAAVVCAWRRRIGEVSSSALEIRGATRQRSSLADCLAIRRRVQSRARSTPRKSSATRRAIEDRWRCGDASSDASSGERFAPIGRAGGHRETARCQSTRGRSRGSGLPRRTGLRGPRRLLASVNGSPLQGTDQGQVSAPRQLPTGDEIHARSPQELVVMKGDRQVFERGDHQQQCRQGWRPSASSTPRSFSRRTPGFGCADRPSPAGRTQARRRGMTTGALDEETQITPGAEQSLDHRPRVYRRRSNEDPKWAEGLR